MEITYKDVVIIGAGLTGLVTAHKLRLKNKSFVVLEKNDRPGGVINTVKHGNFVYEEGPNTGVVGTPEVVELFEELGDTCRMVEADKNVDKRYILKNGKWKLLPSGLISGITTSLFSFSDKIRLLGEPFRKPGKNPEETLAEMVVRRMGKSFLDYAVDPFILGVYAGDPSVLVPKYALPKLYNLEQKYGSFIGGSIKKAKEPKTEHERKVTRKVFSVEGGLGSLIDALVLSAGKENIRVSINNLSVSKIPDGYRVSVKNADSEFLFETPNLIFTGSAFDLRNTFDFLNSEQLRPITDLYYAKTAEVVLGFEKWEGMPLDGFGALIPHKENRKILGIMFLSSLFKNRAPKGGSLITVFVGGVRNANLVDLSETDIKEIVKQELSELLSIKNFNPELFEVRKHMRAIPQYMKDSGMRFQIVEKIQNENQGLQIAGNLRNGIGMADRIQQAFGLAEKIK